MLDWPSRSAEIQALHFRPPPKAVLWIKHDAASNLLEWTFTFMDLGMNHTISSFSIVARDEHGDFTVDGQSEPNEASALHSVFGGHYARCLQEISQDLLGYEESESE
jgi:hypothetical protein